MNLFPKYSFLLLVILLTSCSMSPETHKEETFTPLTSLKGVNMNITTPQPNSTIQSPTIIQGEVPGHWFFEASFPIQLTNWDGLIIGEGIATAKTNWMTEEMVSFEAIITFDKPTHKNNGSLIFMRSNASGEPEHDDAVEYEVKF
ncbi:hypothetical protein COB57_02660 [Candidatus Peregrinibacteria bacterium]|nr:MAG: hypothetical protein COB57_02660 [Candidatus Peregrinibacteria bacterium]